ncbi:MAG: hypothetical protein KBF88_11965 [Polyangiaceae bacterium]|nr:hypothetical protein [Polyangiaceae bacterium]
MKNKLWMIPALASLLFLAFTVQVVMAEGLFGFLSEHYRTEWGKQVGIDLISSITIGLFFAVAKAKRVGVRSLPWVILTVLTGSIGLFAFAARLLYAGSPRTNTTGA